MIDFVSICEICICEMLINLVILCCSMSLWKCSLMISCSCFGRWFSSELTMMVFLMDANLGFLIAVSGYVLLFLLSRAG